MASGPLLLGRPRADLLRRAATVAGVLGVAAGLAVLAIRQVARSNRPGMVISVLTPYLVVVPLVGAVLAGVARQRMLAAAGVVTVALFGATQLPLYVGGPGVDGPSEPLRVLTSNLRYGFADAEDLVAQVRDGDVDVLAVQELTTDAVEALDVAGIAEVLPFRVLSARPRAAGVGLYARFPLEEVPVDGRYDNHPVAATMTFDRGDAHVDMTIASVHPRAPWPHSTATWSDEFDQLVDWADRRTGPVVIAGDFNASNDHRQMRTFFDAGFVDSAARAGAGYLATYPSDRFYPPLIAIDHVLTRGGPAASSVKSITISGTDHRAVHATIAVPYQPHVESGER